MNIRRARQLIQKVAEQFDVTELINDQLGSQDKDEGQLTNVGRMLGLSQQDLQRGISPVPDAVYQRYPVFDMLSQWQISELMAGKYGPYRMLEAIFGDKCSIPDIPSKQEEQKMIVASVRARCALKAAKINELFPGAYPLELPVHQFFFTVNELISFPQVYTLADAYDEVIQRFSDLFFAAVQADLPEKEALELDLLGTILGATDLVMPTQQITHAHMQQYRAVYQEEGYKQLASYVRIHLVCPVWKAREFYQDPNYVAAYIAGHKGAKAEIRSFLTKVISYECHYVFIHDTEAHERLQNMDEDELSNIGLELPEPYTYADPILIPREDGEITEDDRLIAEHALQMVGSVRFGGIAPRETEVCADQLQRLNKRLGVSIGKEKPLSNGYPSASGKEADQDE